ncbi:MAG: hypothetical protein U1E60_09095 [Reyranellaceae bacterium]
MSARHAAVVERLLAVGGGALEQVERVGRAVVEQGCAAFQLLAVGLQVGLLEGGSLAIAWARAVASPR